MTHQCPFQPDKSVALNRILLATLRVCECDIISTFRKKIPRFKQRKEIMRSLFRTKIAIARFLVTYRWSKNSQTITTFEHFKNPFDEKCNLVLQYFEHIKPLHLSSCVKCLQCPSIKNQTFFEIQNIPQNPNNIFLSLLLQSNIPRDITRITLRKNIIYCAFKSKYFLSLEINNGQISLKNYGLEFPAHMSKKYVSKISAIIKFTISSSKSLFNDLHLLMLRLRILGKFLIVCQEIKKYQNIFGFTIHSHTTSALIRFGTSLDHSIEYWIVPKSSGIWIFSTKLMRKTSSNTPNDNCPHFFKKFIDIEKLEDVDYQGILSEMRDCAVYERLCKLMTRLSHSFIAAGLPTYSLIIENYRELVIRLFDFEFCRVFLSRQTNEPDANIFNDLGVSAKEFVHALTCDKCERKQISHSLYLVSLSRSLLNTVYNGVVDALGLNQPVKSIYQRAIRFSFAPSFYVRMRETCGKLMLDVKSNDDTIIFSTNEMIMLSSNHRYDRQTRDVVLRNAIMSAKAACVILEMQNYLLSKGIESKIENNKMHFALPNFECVEFKCQYNETWSLLFIKPSRTIDGSTVCIHGNRFTADFCKWIWNLVQNVCKFMSMELEMQSTNDMVRYFLFFEIHNKLSFSFRVLKKLDPAIHVSIDSLSFERRIGFIEHFNVTSYKAPSISFSFSFNTPFKSICNYYGSIEQPNIPFNSIVILLCSYVNLIYWTARVFPSWNIQMPIQETIQLVYKSKITLLIVMPSYSHHKLYISPIDKDQLITIPLGFLEKPSRNNHQLAYSFNVRRFPALISNIEEFYKNKEVLASCGFTSYTIENETILHFQKLSINDVICEPKLSIDGIDANITGPYRDKIIPFIKQTNSRSIVRYLFLLSVGGFFISPAVGNTIIGTIKALFVKLTVNMKTSLPTATFDFSKRMITMKLFIPNHVIMISITSQNGQFHLTASEKGMEINGIQSFQDLINYYYTKDLLVEQKYVEQCKMKNQPNTQ